MRVAFCHPDLGVGGAERFIVDAALEMEALGHTVYIYTSHYDPSRCFEETNRLNIQTAATWLPRSCFGIGAAFCAYLRMMVVALFICWQGRSTGSAFDCVIVDQVSAVIPVLKLFSSAKVLFYGHFPDLLLASHVSALRRAYRTPLDWLEGRSTAQADAILTNSHFTKRVYVKTFPQLRAREGDIRVLHPAVRAPSAASLQEDALSWRSGLELELVNWMEGGDVFLSINRFERKKGVALAIRSLQEVIARHAYSSGTCARCRLIVCGGFDPRCRENVQHFQELKELAEDLEVDARVVFLKNVTDQQRRWLLAACKCVLYTPENEHFGIVPLEAMVAGRPVIACNSGGPTETIQHCVTGLLSEPAPLDFANAMVRVLVEPDLADTLRTNAQAHVLKNFSLDRLRENLGSVLDGLTGAAAAPGEEGQADKKSR